ncbi:Uncharacterised protein [Candidatus Venteria ishoeyi]|uniref:Uncharacterized protein n=1 Tax=Candidatus Venteria ishoeyi TaxID=1899563 RepID=A0A1H6F2K4_9GAMM|nr:Uncharacterised protein [Candidatus Venteria ishoeyi]
MRHDSQVIDQRGRRDNSIGGFGFEFLPQSNGLLRNSFGKIEHTSMAYKSSGLIVKCRIVGKFTPTQKFDFGDHGNIEALGQHLVKHLIGSQSVKVINDDIGVK